MYEVKITLYKEIETIKSIKKILILLPFLLSINSVAFADVAFQKFPHVEVRLISSLDTLVPEEPFYLALQMKLDSQWHSYWQNPGDSGSRPYARFKTVESLEISKMQFAIPRRIKTPPLVSFGYENEALYLFSAIYTGPRLESINITVEAEWVVCEVECIPGIGTFSIQVASGDQLRKSSSYKKIQQWVDKLPIDKVPTDLKLFKHSPGKFAARLDDNADLMLVDFFPDENSRLSHNILFDQSSHQSLRKIMVHHDDSYEKESSMIQGLVVVKNDNGEQRSFWIGLNNDTTITPTLLSTLLKILLFAFTGGLLLNLMPCVFPVLAIKFIGIIEASNKDISIIRQSALAYIVGVILSFLTFAGILIAVKSSGEFWGWGFQLQSPVFLAFLIIVFFILALNFFDLISFNGPSEGLVSKLMYKNGLVGQFFTGVLAVIIATPCTAPFMGTAMGFSMTQSWPNIVLIFLFLGFGLAFPYMIFAIWPQVHLLLPKPGIWMKRLKQAMAFPLLGTCIWLLWVLSGVTDVSSVWVMLISFLIISVFVWLNLWFKRAIFFVTGIVLITMTSLYMIVPSVAIQSASKINWLDFDTIKIEKLQRQHNLVFVDYTADWCITCKISEKITFNDIQTIDFITTNNIAMVKADWTNRNKKIADSLAQYNRLGIPFYILYFGNGEHRILPEILTPSIFMNEIKRVI